MVITVTLAVVQEMCARLGAATGRGLLDLVRERFGIGWALFCVTTILITNGGITITEFVGIRAAAELLGLSGAIAAPVAALVVCILIFAAATLNANGNTDIQTADDAARALEPVAGSAAKMVFAVGLLGASVLAAGVLPLATAYSISEAFGFRKDVTLDFRRAPIFLGIFTVLIVLGVTVALLPNVPIIGLLIAMQTLNGILLPVVLVFILLLINDHHLVPERLRNGRAYNSLGWGSVILIGGAAAALVVTQIVGLFYP